jgi:hypothetical protein
LRRLWASVVEAFRNTIKNHLARLPYAIRETIVNTSRSSSVTRGVLGSQSLNTAWRAYLRSPGPNVNKIILCCLWQAMNITAKTERTEVLSCEKNRREQGRSRCILGARSRATGPGFPPVLGILMYFNIHSGCSSHPWDSPLRGLRSVWLRAKRFCAGGTRPPFARDGFLTNSQAKPSPPSGRR